MMGKGLLSGEDLGNEAKLSRGRSSGKPSLPVAELAAVRHFFVPLSEFCLVVIMDTDAMNRSD